MSVGEAQERLTECEFIDWLLYFEWRNELAYRTAKGLPTLDVDDQTETAECAAAPTLSAVETHAFVDRLLGITAVSRTAPR